MRSNSLVPDSEEKTVNKVVLLRVFRFTALTLVGALVLEHGPGDDAEQLVLHVEGDVEHLVDLPYFDAQSDEAADLDDGVGLVVQDVEEDDDGLEHVEEDRADGEALEGFTVVPELNVCKKRGKTVFIYTVHVFTVQKIYERRMVFFLTVLLLCP